MTRKRLRRFVATQVSAFDSAIAVAFQGEIGGRYNFLFNRKRRSFLLNKTATNLPDW